MQAHLFIKIKINKKINLIPKKEISLFYLVGLLTFKQAYCFKDRTNFITHDLFFPKQCVQRYSFMWYISLCQLHLWKSLFPSFHTLPYVFLFQYITSLLESDLIIYGSCYHPRLHDILFTWKNLIGALLYIFWILMIEYWLKW